MGKTRLNGEFFDKELMKILRNQGGPSVEHRTLDAKESTVDDKELELAKEEKGILDEEKELLKNAKKGSGKKGGGSDDETEIPAKRLDTFRIFMFLVIIGCAGGVLVAGNSIVQTTLVICAGILFIAEPYLAPFLKDKLKILGKPETVITIFKVILLIGIIFIGDQGTQVIVLGLAAGVFLLLPSAPGLFRRIKNHAQKAPDWKDSGGSMGSLLFKFAIAIAVDVADFFIGRIPIVGTGFDIIQTFIGYKLWGGTGLISGWEIIDITDQLDGFVPSLTILGFFSIVQHGFKPKPKEGKQGININLRQPGSVLVKIIVVIFFIAILLVGGLAAMPAHLYGGEGVLARASRTVSTSVVKSAAWIKDNNPITLIANWIDKRIAIASGSFYEGTVEENKDLPLGVYLKDLKPADPQFWEDEEIIVWATLEAMTIEKPVNITVSCTADGVFADNITPSRKFNISSYEQQLLECKFNKETVLNKVKNGAKNVRFNANYNFETMSYLKTYFMDTERMRSMRRQNLNPLDEFGITDKYPIAIFTNGPLKIGMETLRELPIGVPSDLVSQREVVTIGVTLENRWKGRITKINSLEIQLPDSLDINHCDHPFTAAKKAEEAGYNKYELDFTKLDARKKAKLENITTYQTFRCWIDVKDRTSLLGKDPISTKYIRLTADYDYQSYETTTIYIKKIEKGSGTTGGAGSLYQKGCCAKESTKCTKLQSDCTGTSFWSAEMYCTASDSAKNGQCTSCTDICNTQTQCPSSSVKLVDYGWCCESSKCETGSLSSCPIPAVSEQFDVTAGSNCLTDERISQILTAANSPAKDAYAAFNRYAIQYGIRSDVALAFFNKESTYGTAGVAVETKSIGNVKYSGRCIGKKMTVNGVDWCGHDTWEQGIQDWFDLIKNIYVGQTFKVKTVETIVPIYCPAGPPDYCDVQGYIKNIRDYVSGYQTP